MTSLVSSNVLRHELDNSVALAFWEAIETEVVLFVFFSMGFLTFRNVKLNNFLLSREGKPCCGEKLSAFVQDDSDDSDALRIKMIEGESQDDDEAGLCSRHHEILDDDDDDAQAARSAVCAGYQQSVPDQGGLSAFEEELAAFPTSESSGSGAKKSDDDVEVLQGRIKACLLSDEPEEAATLFSTLNTHLFPVHSLSTKASMLFSTLVKAFVQRGEALRALNFYHEHKSTREECSSLSIPCSRPAYNALIDFCARQGEMVRAAGIFRDMCELGVDPDLVTYSTLIKGHCVHGEVEEALRLFALMRQRKIGTPDAVLFNMMLDGCVRQGMRTLAEHVLHDMESSGVAPSNLTLSLLVKLYSRSGELDTASELLETLPWKYGFDVSVSIYACLIATCVSDGQLDKALGVFEVMQKAKCAADTKTYQALINGCLKEGNLEQAVRLIEDALIPGGGREDGPRIRLGLETLENALLMIGRRQRSQDLGRPLLARLEKAEVEVPERVKFSLMRATTEGGARVSRFHVRRTSDQTWRDWSSSPPKVLRVEEIC